MVDIQIAGRGLADRRVLDAMREVPREAFVEPGFEEFAYDDTPLPIASGQTISQPYIVAVMIEAAVLEPGDCALEIGTGSGYAAAVLSRIAQQVYTIERHADLDAHARAADKASCAHDDLDAGCFQQGGNALHQRAYGRGAALLKRCHVRMA